MWSEFVPGRYSFSKQQRLLARADFDRVFKEGLTLKNQYVTLLARVSSSLSPRLGIIVTKKNFPRAVDRNRFRRVVRECFRLNRETLPRELIVMAHKGAGQLSSHALRAVLDQIWVKLLSKVDGNTAFSSLKDIKNI